MKRFILPIILLLLFISESIFVDVLPSSFINGDFLLVPRFLVVTIVFISITGNRTEGMVLGGIFGLLTDIVYTGILGIYMFSYPLIAYLISKLARILQNHIVIISILSVIGVLLIECFVYLVNILIGFTSISVETFLYERLISTLLLNGVFIALVSYPLFKLVEKLNVDE
ncbi:rod shape-determining protein MreD [Litchfieldia alkalitelluris]|uniref:rod shape-determining protein MreD n=1 Tax=Litchfieldia alkalitelluris TaxID=304268 RepID=UPI000997628D|nr:rod shape-determining protein MreD [Litchfieldia alkalitelluris]